MGSFITVFNSTGPCEVDVDHVAKAWDHRFVLSQWGDEYRLIQYLRKGSEATKVKCTISAEQAKELIDKLQLVRTQEMFASAGSWRKADWDFRSMMKSPRKNERSRHG